ncbi:hypothetical protein [Vreelandella lionensis]|jgi:hypothetical protein|uniref:hypothetical protein n=1 Tax=Vreelandella lionensis TaxID=1144478 RepID=UPI0009F6E723|nr:hypothetical protein [Halomonas lionensis]
MPQNHLVLDDELERQLEAVRQQLGLETIDQAAEWLARRRLRKGVGNLTGRGRALYEIRGRSD